jgi:hypothetical protein
VLRGEAGFAGKVAHRILRTSLFRALRKNGDIVGSRNRSARVEGMAASGGSGGS